jgi:hypothetical protein
MYPVDFDVPGTIAARTRRYLLGCGIGAPTKGGPP